MHQSPFGSVMRSLVVAVYELGVAQILVVGHRDCGMQSIQPAAVVEKMPTFGGTCLNIGCIPSKAMLQASELFEEAGHKFGKMGIGVSEPCGGREGYRAYVESLTLYGSPTAETVQ